MSELERLKQALEALANKWEQTAERTANAPGLQDAANLDLYVSTVKYLAADFRTLLAPSPAEGTGEGRLNCPVCGSGEEGDCVCGPRDRCICNDPPMAREVVCRLHPNAHLATPAPVSSGEACCMAGTPLAGPGVTHEVGCTRPAPVSSDKARDPASPCRCHPADDDSGHCGGWMPPAPVVTPSAEGSEP